jgi:hypothetical protein
MIKNKLNSKSVIYWAIQSLVRRAGAGADLWRVKTRTKKYGCQNINGWRLVNNVWCWVNS